MAKVTQVLSGTDDYLNQFGIHNEFDEIGRVISTDYWESDVCKNGFFFMAFNKGVYSLLVPEEGKPMLDELKSYIPTSVVISRGVYKGKPDNYEIMFDDMSNRPYVVSLGSRQVFPVPGESDAGWKGCFYIYTDNVDNYQVYFRNVYFRITDTLPCLTSPEDPPPGRTPAVKIDKVEHFESHGNQWTALGFEGEEPIINFMTKTVQEGAPLKRFSLSGLSSQNPVPTPHSLFPEARVQWG